MATAKKKTAQTEENAKLTAKEHIEQAANLLCKLGSEGERIAWLLEDTLNYIDEMGEKEAQRAGLTSELEEGMSLEDIAKLVNS